MRRKETLLQSPIQAYYEQVACNEPDILAAARIRIRKLAHGKMHITPQMGKFLNMMVHLTGAGNILEIGTYGGYSTLWLAYGTKAKITTLDKSAEGQEAARSIWENAGVGHRITAHTILAEDFLKICAQEDKRFDIIFIDADKGNYSYYLEKCLPLLTPHGCLIFDNTLGYSGCYVPQCKTQTTSAIAAFNERVMRKTDIEALLIPLGDGCTLIMAGNAER